MSFGNWFRRLFSPAPSAGSAGDEAALREEYGAAAAGETGPGGVAGGPSGLAGLEDTEAAQDAVDADEPPPGSAP